MGKHGRAGRGLRGLPVCAGRGCSDGKCKGTRTRVSRATCTGEVARWRWRSERTGRRCPSGRRWGQGKEAECAPLWLRLRLPGAKPSGQLSRETRAPSKRDPLSPARRRKKESTQQLSVRADGLKFEVGDQGACLWGLSPGNGTRIA